MKKKELEEILKTAIIMMVQDRECCGYSEYDALKLTLEDIAMTEDQYKWLISNR